MKRLAVLLAALAFFAACGGDDGEDEPVAEGSTTTEAEAGPEETTTTTAAAEEKEDPYEVFLRTNPEPSLEISREDAQTRAMLGCDEEWAPGTVDRALADAYRPYGVCD